MSTNHEVDTEAVGSSGFALKNIEIPHFGEVECGFPSPATDYIESNLNLHEFLIKKPVATFFMRAKGDSMIGAGIFSGDLLIVDRSIEVRSGHVIVASIQGQFTLKRYLKVEGRAMLAPENQKYKSVEIIEGSEFQVFGVVTFNIHRHL